MRHSAWNIPRCARVSHFCGILNVIAPDLDITWEGMHTDRPVAQFTHNGVTYQVGCSGEITEIDQVTV